MPQRQLAHLAGTDDQHRPAGQVAEDLAGQLAGGVGDGDRIASDCRLRAHSLCRLKRPPAQSVQDGPDLAVLAGIAVGILDLLQDLRFPDNHRIQG